VAAIFNNDRSIEQINRYRIRHGSSCTSPNEGETQREKDARKNMMQQYMHIKQWRDRVKKYKGSPLLWDREPDHGPEHNRCGPLTHI
jgi:hypothetical protein